MWRCSWGWTWPSVPVKTPLQECVLVIFTIHCKLLFRSGLIPRFSWSNTFLMDKIKCHFLNFKPFIKNFNVDYECCFMAQNLCFCCFHVAGGLIDSMRVCIEPQVSTLSLTYWSSQFSNQLIETVLQLTDPTLQTQHWISQISPISAYIKPILLKIFFTLWRFHDY